MTHFAWLSGVACVAVVTASCQSSASERSTDEHLRSEYDQSGRLTKLTYDRNGDGKIDTWGYMDGARVVRIEVDENGDGTVDRWEYHKAPTGSTASQRSTSTNAASSVAGVVDPTLERIDRSTRHDGTVSRHEYFDNGVLTRVEEDTDGNGKIDKWETYSDGSLAVMALDTTGRGTPDRRLIYLSDGSLSRIEADPNGSGTFRPVTR